MSIAFTIRCAFIIDVAPASENADAIVWLCSEQSTFVTGAAITVDGGKLAGIMM